MTRLSSFSYFFIVLFGATQQGCDVWNGKPVARVLDEKISKEEFIERYTAFLASTSVRDNIVTRQQIINNMVNERLILDDMKRQGMDRDGTFRRREKEIIDQALLDRYAKRITTDTLTVSEQELLKEFEHYNTKVSGRYLYAKTNEEALQIKIKLERGATFEALAKEIFTDPSLANNGGYLGFFGWGEMDPGLEQIAFSIPIGTISDPIKLKRGYGILKVESRIRQPLASEYDFINKREKLAKVIEDRKIIRVVDGAIDQLHADLVPQFDQQILSEVFRHWKEICKYSDELLDPEHSIPMADDLADATLVRFNDQVWTVNDFIERLQRTTDKQRRRVNTIDDIRSIAIGLAAREVLLARARQLGFEKSSDVLAQVRRVRDEYILKRWTKSVQDTVERIDWNDTELRMIYAKNREEYLFPPEVNVAEILVGTEKEAKLLLSRIRAGEKFSTLARKYSIRSWAAQQDGELGYGTKASYGILGEKFFAARMGDLLGPERVDPYYGIFRIVDRREERQKTFEEARDQIIEQTKFLRKQEMFARAVNHLRSRANISIDTEILANIKLD